jgi:DNA primase
VSIPDDLIEQIRDAADPVTLIGEHVNLKRTGTDWRGPCPFHGGTHRNLAVIPRKQMFYCFVCHEGGDVFTFFMKKFGMDYPTAVREVARKVGIVIPERPTGGPDPREPLFEAVAAAHEWYMRQLREADEATRARRYLESRGFDLETVLPYGLGYAPAGGDAMIGAMGTLGITPERLIEAGLAVRRDERIRARFWNRLLFPIHDLRGRVVGFGGRVIGDGEPKYLNSPESEVFHKGRLLYHLHDAKHAIRQADQAIVVEGYFDVLRLVEAGIGNVVAPLGTGFTADQATLLRRITEQVTLLFDSDAAGLRATFRVADELLRVGARVSVATLPEGEDPDTLVQTGGARAVQAVLHDAIDVLERKLQLLDRKGWLGSLGGRRKALDRLLSSIRAAADPVTRDLYVSRVAEALGVSRDSVLREAGRGGVGGGVDRAAPDADRATPSASRGSSPERDLVRVLVYEPEWRARIVEHLPDRRLVREPEATLLEALAGLDAGTAAAELLGRLDDGGARILLAQLLAESWGTRDVGELVAKALDRIESRSVDADLREIRRRLPLAEEADKEQLARDVVTLRAQANQLNPARWNVIRKGRNSGR